jgi:hypothetical protein
MPRVKGQVEVSGWDRPEVSVVAIKRLGTHWGAREAFEDTEVEMEQKGCQIYLRTRRQHEGGFFDWLWGGGRGPAPVDYTVKVPATSSVSISTVTCEVVARDIIGSLHARSVTGTVDVQRVGGNIILSTTNGKIQGQDLGGTLGVKSVNGGIDLRRCSLTSLQAKTVNGKISVETSLDPQGNYSASTVNGSCRLAVPKDSRGTVEARFANGDVSCELPCQLLDSSRGHWHGQFGGGGANITFNAVNGGLTIAVSDQVANVPVAAPTPPAPSAPPGSESAEMAILKAVERGEMGVEEALQRLTEVEEAASQG